MKLKTNLNKQNIKPILKERTNKKTNKTKKKIQNKTTINETKC